MPRYFFHLSFGQRVVPDEDGIELANRTAARDEAVAVVSDLANPEIGGNSRRWASWFLEVADERERFFRTPIGYPALEVVAPDTCTPRTKEPVLKPAPAAATAPLAHGPFTGDTAKIVQQMAARRRRTMQFLKANKQLRRELTSVCLASEGIRVRTDRLVSLARAASGRS
jgi:uncharacterized protein DUF6894